MNRKVISGILLGLLSNFPRAYRLAVWQRVAGESAPTSTVRYSYSTWLRHLVMAHANNLPTDPQVVVEIGPGNSFGVGLAALLCGATSYYALDVEKIADTPHTQTILNDLLILFNKRENIPDDEELPDANPKLSSYAFPGAVLPKERLARSLDKVRLDRMYQVLGNTTEAKEDEIRFNYLVPWHNSALLRDESTDMIISQAVLEHVDDLEGIYASMWRWLKPGGFMSHVIDFRSHGIAETWDGHWAYAGFTWKLMRGRRPDLINRCPYSEHSRLLEKYGFEIVFEQKITQKPELSRRQLAREFKDLSDEDLSTSGVFYQAIKPRNPTRR